MMIKLLAGMALCISLAATAHATEMVDRGEYLATIMDCGGCHTAGALAGQPNPALHLAGSSIGFELPGLGIFYPPNLTSDHDTGLGSWTEVDIVKVLRTGIRPDGRELAPIMPWRAYSKLSENDMQALASYLKNLKPVTNPVPHIAASSDTATGPYLTVALPKK
jgi:mono/diheme cytochrome c family protein